MDRGSTWSALIALLVLAQGKTGGQRTVSGWFFGRWAHFFSGALRSKSLSFTNSETLICSFRNPLDLDARQYRKITQREILNLRRTAIACHWKILKSYSLRGQHVAHRPNPREVDL